METSKKILLVSYLAAIFLTAAVVIGTFLGVETSDVTTIASLTWGEVAVSNAFYYRKAALENIPKILAGIDKNLLSQLDISQLFQH